MNQQEMYEVLQGHLKTLKMPTIRSELDNHMRLAQAKSLTYLEFVHGLVGEEIAERKASNLRRRLKSAAFPVKKSMEAFDFNFQPTLSREKVHQLSDCRWVANAENIILAGHSGTGKTHLAIALGLKAVESGYRAYFTTVADLLDQANVAMATGRLKTLENKLFKQDVLILDELGYLKVDRAQGNFLFKIISKAYEQFSLIITTNKDFSGWAEIFVDQVQVAAMLDRLLHHSQILNIKGESYRIREHQKLVRSAGHPRKQSKTGEK